MSKRKKENYISTIICILTVGLFLGVYFFVIRSTDSWFSTQSVDLWKWIYFVDALRWFINHFVAKTPVAFLFVGLVIILSNWERHKKLWVNLRQDMQQKTWTKRIGSVLMLCKKIILLHSRYFWGIFLIWAWWFIISTLFTYINTSEVISRDSAWDFLQEIESSKELWINLWLENFYDIQLINTIEYSLWFRALWLLAAVLVSWLISTLSFWNKVWRWVSSFILVIALLLFLIWWFLHFLLIELQAWIV